MVNVKPLEWEYSHIPHRTYPLWKAKTIVGQYVVVDTAKSVEWYLDGKTQAHDTSSVEAAKAAAQSDYQARILSALSDTANTPRTEREALEKGCPNDPKSDPENQNIGDQRAVGHGMAIAAAIIMRVWGHSTEATEILNAAGYTSLQKLLDDGVDDYDMDALKPLFEDPFSAEETPHG